MFAGADCGVIVSVKELEASSADRPFMELQMILSINRNVAYGLILTVIVIVILMFDTVFGLFLELIHVSFEFVEEMLDILIEQLFQTDLHDTQIIVFYLMWAIAGYPCTDCISCCERCLAGIANLKKILSPLGHSLKKEILAYWQDLPATGKTKWIMGFLARSHA